MALAHGLNFEDMFDLAPVSLWMEDYSALKQLFDQWRAQGVHDLQAHLRADPVRLQQCSQSYKVLRVNQFTLDLFKAPDQATLQARIGEVFRDDMHDGIGAELQSLWDGRQGFETRSYNYALDGRRLNVLVRARVLPGYEACWSRVLIALEDITQQEQSSSLLRRSEQYARDLFENSPVALWVQDFSGIKRMLGQLRDVGVHDLAAYLKVHPDFVYQCMQEVRVLDVNRHTVKMLGARSKSHVLEHLPQVLGPEMRAAFTQQLMGLWHGQLVQQREAVCRSLQGHTLHTHMEFAILEAHTERWDVALLSMVDLTERKLAQANLEFLSHHDVLTQLYNRTFYNAELQRLERHGPWPVSVLVLDMNGLKLVNDEKGHAAGDALLRRVGDVLRQTVHAPACAARVGGDEFTVLLPGTDEASVQGLQAYIREVLAINNQCYPGELLCLSMGAATAHWGHKIEAAVHRADQAMYADKAQFYQYNGQRNRRLVRTP